MSGPRTITAAEVPTRPPYNVTPVWSGTHGDWRLDVSRVEGDPLLHVVALHLATGTVHAERLDAATPRAVKAWADGLPAVVTAGGDA